VVFLKPHLDIQSFFNSSKEFITVAACIPEIEAKIEVQSLREELLDLVTIWNTQMFAPGVLTNVPFTLLPNGEIMIAGYLPHFTELPKTYYSKENFATHNQHFVDCKDDDDIDMLGMKKTSKK
jgi:hypothetical protein